MSDVKSDVGIGFIMSALVGTFSYIPVVVYAPTHITAWAAFWFVLSVGFIVWSAGQTSGENNE